MLELRAIRVNEIEAAKAVMAAGFQETWGLTYAELTSLYDPLEDMEDVQGYYYDRNGTFLVLVHDEQVIGTGGIGQLDAETAEMKRLWLLKEYRGRGLGRQMAMALLHFAETHGYRRVRLIVVTPELQPQAVRLYATLGFRPIAPYCNSAGLFLEKWSRTGPMMGSPLDELHLVSDRILVGLVAVDDFGFQ